MEEGKETPEGKEEIKKESGPFKENTGFQDSFKILIQHMRQKMSWIKPEKRSRTCRKIKRMSEIAKLSAPFERVKQGEKCSSGA